MPKTKRQLRAEAVERLDAMHDEDYIGNGTWAKAITGHWMGIDETINILISLLSDDETPEGDAVGIMRDVADRSDRHTLYHGMCEIMQAIQQEPEDGCMTGSELAIAMRTFADMVERDYMRRDAVQDVIKGQDCAIANAQKYIKSLQDAIAAKPEVGAAAKWKRRYEECNKAYRELQDERESLKRASERDADVMESLNVQLSDMQAKVDDLTADNAVLSGKAQAAEEMLLYLLEGGEPDWEGWLGNHDGLCDYFRERFTATVPQLEDELRQARKYGDIWPRFEDGTPAEFGDEFLWGDDEVYTVDGIKLERGFTGVVGQGHAAHAPLKRPSLKANDGKPIAIGETLYGLSDGKAWTVTGITHGGKYPVLAEDRDMLPMEVVERALKPEWLSHEGPDSARRIMSEHTQDVCDKLERLGITIPEEFAIANRSYIDRIEKLAKEGA